MALLDQDFEMWSGDSITLNFVIEDTADLAGSSSIKWAMSRSVRGPKLINKEGTYEANVVTIELIPEDTEDIRPSRYYHELEIIDGEGRVSTAAIGSMRIWPTLIPQPVEEE